MNPTVGDTIRAMANEMRGPQPALNWNVPISQETLDCRNRIKRKHGLHGYQIIALAVAALEGLLDEGVDA